MTEKKFVQANGYFDVSPYLFIAPYYAYEWPVCHCMYINKVMQGVILRGKKVVTLFIHEKAVTRLSRYTYALHPPDTRFTYRY